MTWLRCSMAGKLSPLPSSTTSTPWSDTCTQQAHAVHTKPPVTLAQLDTVHDRRMLSAWKVCAVTNKSQWLMVPLRKQAKPHCCGGTENLPLFWGQCPGSVTFTALYRISCYLYLWSCYVVQQQGSRCSHTTDDPILHLPKTHEERHRERQQVQLCGGRSTSAPASQWKRYEWDTHGLTNKCADTYCISSKSSPQHGNPPWERPRRWWQQLEQIWECSRKPAWGRPGRAKRSNLRQN